MKKAFDQTVRELKREVNKKVLKVPGIEQKVLDATSNEPWGPHGSLLADIAQATKNYHEYQMIMSIIWKRINDTGKNWRHVYKALIILEYLVAHGSERVIDETREHAYQISTLSDFQYIDSSGRDQGSNVRKKSQSLVVLVNDKERIQEVRQKAAANRDKFRNTSMGGMYRPSSYSGTGGNADRYDDDRYEGRYGSRDDDRNGYGREREWGSRDDDRYGKYGADGDRYSRESDERYGRDGYRDDDYRGRSRSIDDYQHGSRSRSSDRERERAYEDDGQYSYRGSGARADDHSQDGSSSGKQLDRKFSEQNLGAPPSYEEALGEAHSPGQSERDGETLASAPKTSASLSNSPTQAIPAPGMVAAPVLASPPAPALAPAPSNKEIGSFEEFDPRVSFSAAPVTSNGAEMDLLGSLSDSFSNPLAIMPITSGTTATDGNTSANFSSGPAFGATPSASSVGNQPFEDPFGDGPFKAIPTTVGSPFQPQNITPPSSFHPITNQSSELTQPIPEVVANYGDAFTGMTYTPPINPNDQLSSTNAQFVPHEFPPSNQNTDILADILPLSGPPPPVASQMGFPSQGSQPPSHTNFLAQPSYPTPLAGFSVPTGHSGQVMGNPGPISSVSQTGFQAPGTNTVQPSANLYGNFLQQQPAAPHMASQTSGGPSAQYNPAKFFSQAQPTPTMTSQPHLTPSTGQLALVPQPSKDKFDPKSGVWADTLSRGLVNLNISGPKTNPLADIGVDFDAINRKERRTEKPTTTPMTSTINMGKAMGSGSGMGRAAASSLRPPQNPMGGSGMGMGMGMGGPGAGMGVAGSGAVMGGYGGMNQPMGMGGYGVNGMHQTMGMGMGMGMAQGSQMQPTGFPPGSTTPGGYNPMMGRGGGYSPHQPYSGGY